MGPINLCRLHNCKDEDKRFVLKHSSASLCSSTAVNEALLLRRGRHGQMLAGFPIGGGGTVGELQVNAEHHGEQQCSIWCVYLFIFLHVCLGEGLHRSNTMHMNFDN